MTSHIDQRAPPDKTRGIANDHGGNNQLVVRRADQLRECLEGMQSAEAGDRRDGNLRVAHCQGIGFIQPGSGKVFVRLIGGNPDMQQRLRLLTALAKRLQFNRSCRLPGETRGETLHGFLNTRRFTALQLPGECCAER